MHTCNLNTLALTTLQKLLSCCSCLYVGTGNGLLQGLKSHWEKGRLIFKVLKQLAEDGVPSCFHVGIGISGTCSPTVHFSPDDTQMRRSRGSTAQLRLLCAAEPEGTANGRQKLQKVNKEKPRLNFPEVSKRSERWTVKYVSGFHIFPSRKKMGTVSHRNPTLTAPCLCAFKSVTLNSHLQ